MQPRVVDLSHHNIVGDFKGRYKNRGLTLERLKSLLSYDSTSGYFKWGVSRGMVKAGQIAGSTNRSNGYVYIGIDGNIYLAHYLAWFYQTGQWPSDEIDHRDLNHSNNRWKNLREATPQQNCANRPKRADSKNPYKGISRKGAKWRAQIVLGGKRRSLGYFATAELAHNAYMEAAKLVHGEFARAA